MTSDQIASLLRNYLQDFQTFEIEGGEIVSWGEIHVTLLKESDYFNKLYKGMQQMLIDNGAVFNEPEYLGNGFIPHVTVQGKSMLNKDEKVILKEVTLIDMFPSGDFEQRLVAAKVELAP